MEVKRPSDSWRNVFRYPKLLSGSGNNMRRRQKWFRGSCCNIFRHPKLLSGSGNNMRRRQKLFRAIDRIGVDIPGDDSPRPPPRQFGRFARM